MRCKIKWKESPCIACRDEAYCPKRWGDCDQYGRFASRARKGFEGEIQEYDVWNEGTEIYVTIKVNKRRTIFLISDGFCVGRDNFDDCLKYYDIIDCLEIDGVDVLNERMFVHE